MSAAGASVLRVGFCASTLERVFASCFADSENTCLLGGVDEPIYLPATGEQAQHRLYYRLDYFASALHEVAHWCIAGAARRKLQDFGYWYAPDGRDAGQQRAFEAVEARPQALEWCFSRACNFPFRVSLDNLEGGAAAAAGEARFRSAVNSAAQEMLARGLPPRAQVFFNALAREFATGQTLAGLRASPAPGA